MLVANRGEIARRVFRTCRELGLSTVAVFSDADESAPFVGEADVAVRLPGSAPNETYLRGDLVIAAALKAGADAVHPGYGFLSENARFARDVEAAGLTWIGPTPQAIDAMGDKIRAKELMFDAGVPQLGRLEPGAVTSADLPVLVKASAGGGGRGMRVVRQLDELERTIEQASAEAASAFGDPTVFVEHYLEAARHVEVQVMADTRGTVWVVGDRDCSIQRRHQKVVEEAPAPGLSDSVRGVLHDAARAAAEAVDYVGAGTVEFMVAGEKVFFLEMNTRLQVEHPVTEAVFGLDLVALQIAVAEGRPLVGDVPQPAGHAVEVRLYAEDPADDWQPQTGTLRTFDVPVGPGIRVDSGVEAGSAVGIHYDAMIAKIVAHGPDRSAAVRRLGGVLRRSRIHGVTTNREFLRAILADDDFAAARLRTTLLDDRLEAWTAPRMDEGQVRRAASAAALAEATSASTGATVLGRIPTAYRNVPSQPRTRTYVLSTGGAEVTIPYSAGPVLHDLDDVTVVEATPTRVVLDVAGVVEAYVVSVGTGSVDVDGPHGAVDLVAVPVFVDPADVVAEGSLLAPMPAAVVEVAVVDGQDVRTGDVVVVLEAMKMQHTITAPTDGVVTQLSVTAGSQVESGAVLAVIDVSTGESPQGEKP
ncbi:biotin/lipoyl-binding protein [Aeromicrobium endophyticum]|uniref:Biotin/lipoyl-binding protein n=1 Tax=Aeromicrobium endophyticum TaxID=2292704 RepID=A0A371PBE6_9ACTN|nr:biotin/lipoyl-binding protein [Aeromicrobium endophyticum]